MVMILIFIFYYYRDKEQHEAYLVYTESSDLFSIEIKKRN